jgi:hypothetical protein
MVNKPKRIGRDAENAVVGYLVANGWPNAERRTLKGSADQGDITGTPGICWEVKGGEQAKQASDADIRDWLDETFRETENAHADHGVLVVQRRGFGPKRGGQWWAVVTLYSLMRIKFPQDSVWPLVGSYYTAGIPVRLHLADMCTLLRLTGYGNPLPDPLAGEVA